MKKICILSTVNIKHMTLVSHYTDFLERKKINYDIIYVDKYGENEKNNANKIYKLGLNVDRNWSKVKKLIQYIKFRNYAIKILKKEKYDYLIIWNSFTAMMFFDYLIFFYKDKYFFNIRDYAGEKKIFIRKIIQHLIKNSKFTTISSEGFEIFLPKVKNKKLIMIHSLNEKLINLKLKQQDEEIIEITFIGYVRFFENDKKFIDELSNDKRFKINYYGEGAQILEKYYKEKNIENLEFRGRFPVEKTFEFLENTSIINNLYGYNRIELDTAISIKFYYALYLKIPILVYKGTYMEKIANEVGLGIVIDKKIEELGDYIYYRYKEIKNDKDIHKKIEMKLEEIQNRKTEFLTKLKEAINE